MGIGEHLDALKQHWARNFAFLDYFKKVYSRHQPLPRWSDADIDEFIASDPVYGPQLKALRESGNFALGGALVGGAHLGGVAFKYSKSPHVDVANVDPVDVARSFKDLDPESTLVVVVSKTFTTTETMLNARTLKEWIISSLGPQAVANHMIAVSTNLKLVKEFGIDPNNAFAFWDWVGGRYSVCSAVGVLPLSLHYGFPIVQKSQLWQDKNPVLLWSTY